MDEADPTGAPPGPEPTSGLARLWSLTGPARAPRLGLSLDRIVDAAIALADELGVQRLRDKLVAMRGLVTRRGAANAEAQRMEKIRRQKRKRSHRAKMRMLDDKRHQSEKKGRRSSVRPGRDDRVL